MLEEQKADWAKIISANVSKSHEVALSTFQMEITVTISGESDILPFLFETSGFV